jgi:hypothetical protein
MKFISNLIKNQSNVDNPPSHPPARQWIDAQKWELNNAIQFMNSEFFTSVINLINDPNNLISKGYVDPLMLKEFFRDDIDQWNNFVQHIRGKSVLEIGPCVASQLSLWDVASERYVIEPLYNEVVEYQYGKFGKTAFLNLHGFALPGEKLIDVLVQKIDGALLIRNCLDHTPLWPFVLSNICEYMVRGSYLLLWNDLYHAPGYEDGHYDITNDVSMFRRLLKNMGFDIVNEYQYQDSPCINFGCLAIRK